MRFLKAASLLAAFAVGVSLLVTSSARAAGPNLLADPSFESPPDVVWSQQFTGNFVAAGFPIGAAPDGSRFMTLVGYPGGGVPSISQDAGVAAPGATYNLSFFAAARSDSRGDNIGLYPRLSALQFSASLILRNGGGDTVLASTVIDPDIQVAGAWVQQTLVGAAPANAVGNIIVKFDGAVGYRGYDNQQTGLAWSR